MAVLALLIFGFLLIGVLAVWRAFALTYLWQWFIVPLGVPAIGLWHAAGISIIVAYLTYENAAKDKEDGVSTALAMGFLMPAFALFFGWLYHTFM